MLANFVLGILMMIINLGIQVVAITLILRYFQRRVERDTYSIGFTDNVLMLSTVMGVLIVGHGFMFATWALLFQWLGEFSDFESAFYHSTVNFTSLGYGDIVMSPKHRLLGALEAANGVLMFGLTAGSVLSVMNATFSNNKAFQSLKNHINSSD
ncbi:MAG: two pore domain potassium channel family protein [Xanthomonadales bacterium]|nr:potassium channel family protein [Gammaproteobacteria bacterium]MBT8051894.1 potassium channel family protein [Gammaproteobacteria bacterium]MBT8057755.1 potassium channel family protein [Gammaproteobacteria bacterium]NNJ78359.1 two pore domain potassium channel family protein [Xanthomonadales bacterium]NNL04806.1 two pore domain potassium channel family protein [Xanthomonadales bacterium]